MVQPLSGSRDTVWRAAELTATTLDAAAPPAPHSVGERPSRPSMTPELRDQTALGQHDAHEAVRPRFLASGIALALLVRVILFSSVITLILTAFQLLLSYRSERASLDSRFEEIDRATSRSLSDSLWALDTQQIQEQLDGILRLPSMRAAEVYETGPDSHAYRVARGQHQTDRVVVREFPLSCCGPHPEQIGVLHIEATLTDIYRDLATQAAVILVSNAAKTFLVAFFILFIVHQLATRHLIDIANLVRRDEPGADAAPLRLKRPPGQADELDQLVEALNAMRARLRRKANDLGNANARMAAILDNIPDLAWVKDAHGQFIATNRALALSKGFAEAGALVGKSDADLSPPELAEAYVRDDAEVMASGGSKRIEEEHVDADGRVSVIETIKTALRDAHGSVIGTVGISRDITLRRQAEADRDARRIAEAANEAKNAFLAHMSHEIRTPMNAILGMTALALRTGLPPQQRNYIEKAHTSAEALLRIINDILDLSKIEAGKLEVEAIPFSLEEVLDQIAGSLTTRAEAAQLELLVAQSPNLPARLVGDPLRLGQVLLNLTNNAIKFTEKGEVILAAKRVGEDAGSVRVRFEVRDTGIGIPPDVQKRLFQPFVQADASTSRRYGGTGLGLVISRDLVHLMGGELEVASTPGVGSRFFFTLPFAVPQKEAADSGSGSVLRGLRALLADDNAAAREILLDTCASLGLKTDLASDGAEAVARIVAADSADDPYRILLLDWKMPGMDGVACAKALAQPGLLKHPAPIILMLTAFARADALSALAAQEVSVAALLNKPVTPSTLLDACHEALGPEIARPKPATEASPAPAPSLPLKGARLLLVEDNEINQELATELLTREGAEVSVAANGQEGIEAVRSGKFDAVLMDCQMPVMDGYEATRVLRQDPRLHQLPIIAMTANAMTGDREAAMAAGMNDHIAKPIVLDELVSTLVRWLPPRANESAPT